MLNCLVILLLLIPVAHGRVVENSDLHFLFGYQAFLKKEFSTCVAEFNIVLKSEKRKHLVQKTSLFQSICKAKLNERKEAAFEAVRIETKYLNSWDKRHYVRLKNYLNEDFNQALKEKNAPLKPQFPLYFSLTPYAGMTSYSETTQKKKAGFQGFTGQLSYHDWNFVVGFEKYTLGTGKDFQGFSQNQGHLAVGRKWKDLTLTGRYTTITSSTPAQDSIRIYGAGLTYQLFASTKVFIDGYYSDYPGATVGRANVLESVLSVEQGIFRNDVLAFWTKLGVEQTSPDSSQIRNGTSSIPKGFANRAFVDIYLRLRTIVLGAGFWAGREVYGVRNNGLMVFSTAEEHLGGQNISARWDMSQRVSLNLLYMNENIRINTTDSHSSTTLGTFTYNFY